MNAPYVNNDCKYVGDGVFTHFLRPLPSISLPISRKALSSEAHRSLCLYQQIIDGRTVLPTLVGARCCIPRLVVALTCLSGGAAGGAGVGNGRRQGRRCCMAAVVREIPLCSRRGHLSREHIAAWASFLEHALPQVMPLPAAENDC